MQNILNKILITLNIGGSLFGTIVYSIAWLIICQFNIPQPFDVIKVLMAIPFLGLVGYSLVHALRSW